MIARFFELRARGTTVAAELRGGAVTLVTMSYIIFVQPAVLSQHAGMDFGAVMAATCLSAALATLVIGLAEAGIVTKHPAPSAFVQIGDLTSPVTLVALAGLGLTAVLVARRVPGGILIGMVASTLLAVAAGLVRPAGVLAALFFSPLVAMVGGGIPAGGLFYYPITAPAVILVGSLMMSQVARVAWPDPTEAIPAFAVLVMIPFTFNIAHGVAAGILAPVLMKAGDGRGREVSWLMWALAVLVVASYALLPRLRH